MRYERGEFRAEGPQAVREAIKYGDVRSLYVTEEFVDGEFAGGVVVSGEVLAAMTDVTTPQGVIAVCGMPKDSINVINKPRLILIAHEVRDPGNLGTMIRTADAAGADAVIVSGDSVDPWSPKVIRAAAGSHWHLPVINDVALEDVRKALAGVPIVATEAGAPKRYHEIDLRKPIAWLLGNEAHGLGNDAALADASVSLPLYGKAESLNVALAAGILLYASAQAQHA